MGGTEQKRCWPRRGQAERGCERQRGREEEHRERGSSRGEAPPPLSTGKVAYLSVSATPPPDPPVSLTGPTGTHSST